MKSWSLYLFLGIAITTSQGCSAYLVRPVTVHVRDAETKQPIADAKLLCTYMTILDFGLLLVPDAGSTKITNSKGEAVFWIDPYKRALHFQFGHDDYPSEQYLHFNSIATKIVPRKWYQWKNDIYLDMYTLPEATLELVIPDGFRGPIVLRFADEDHPPKVRGQRQFTYTVPKDGVVDISETHLLFRNYADKIILTARFQNGKRIQTQCGINGLFVKSDDPGEPVVHELHFGWQQYDKVFYVGSHADAIELEKTLEERFKNLKQSGHHSRIDVMKELQSKR